MMWFSFFFSEISSLGKKYAKINIVPNSGWFSLVPARNLKVFVCGFFLHCNRCGPTKFCIAFSLSLSPASPYLLLRLPFNCPLHSLSISSLGWKWTLARWGCRGGGEVNTWAYHHYCLSFSLSLSPPVLSHLLLNYSYLLDRRRGRWGKGEREGSCRDVPTSPILFQTKKELPPQHIVINNYYWL